MKKIFVIILQYNNIKDTLICLKSLKKLQITNYKVQITVIDNGSENIQYYLPALSSSQVKIILNKKNLGFAAGNNIGIRYALKNDADYILLLNNDTLIDKNLTSELLKTAESDEKIGIVAPKIYFAPGFEFHKNHYSKNQRGKVIWYAGGIIDLLNVYGHHIGVDEVDKGQYDKIKETDFASGCCMFVKKKVFEIIGLLDEKYFLYYEDLDFCLRAKKAGFKIIYAPKAIVWHKNAGSAGGSGSKIQDFYITRSRFIFAFKHCSWRTRLALLKQTLPKWKTIISMF